MHSAKTPYAFGLRKASAKEPFEFERVYVVDMRITFLALRRICVRSVGVSDVGP